MATVFFYFTYEPSAGRYFSRMSTLFEARARKERVLHLRASKIVQYVSSVVYPFALRIDGACPCACQSVSRINPFIFTLSKFSKSKWRFVNQILLLSSEIIFSTVKKANVF
jgi:hypothetical protein